jgi:hypothetical protein
MRIRTVRRRSGMLSFDRLDVQAFRASLVAIWCHFWIYRNSKLLHDRISKTGFTHNENQSFGVIGVFMFESLPKNRIHELHLGLVDPTQPPVAPSVGGAIEWSHVC